MTDFDALPPTVPPHMPASLLARMPVEWFPRDPGDVLDLGRFRCAREIVGVAVMSRASFALIAEAVRGPFVSWQADIYGHTRCVPLRGCSHPTSRSEAKVIAALGAIAATGVEILTDSIDAPDPRLNDAIGGAVLYADDVAAILASAPAVVENDW